MARAPPDSLGNPHRRAAACARQSSHALVIPLRRASMRYFPCWQNPLGKPACQHSFHVGHADVDRHIALTSDPACLLICFMRYEPCKANDFDAVFNAVDLMRAIDT